MPQLPERPKRRAKAHTGTRAYRCALLPGIQYQIESLERRLLLSEASFYMPDAFGRSFLDAEQLGYSDIDRSMDWAGVASNMLAWSEWGIVDGRSTEDDVFAYFRDHFTDLQGDERDAIGWY